MPDRNEWKDVIGTVVVLPEYRTVARPVLLEHTGHTTAAEYERGICRPVLDVHHGGRCDLLIHRVVGRPDDLACSPRAAVRRQVFFVDYKERVFAAVARYATEESGRREWMV